MKSIPRLASQITLVAAVGFLLGCDGASTSPDELGMSPELNRSNNAARRGAAVNYQIGMMEYITAPGSNEIGRTVFFSDRGNKQLAFHFVPGDTRRDGRTNMTYIVDQRDGAATGGLGKAQTEGAIDRAMGTWDAQTCSNPAVTKFSLARRRRDLGVVESILGFGGILAFFADITHAGWLPVEFFNSPPFFPPDGGDFILAATFTFGFIDASGFTDINNDGKLDAAFREIYYNNNFPWGINTGFPIDVETIALHEAGHGLSQAHFGDLFQTDANGLFHFAPRAVMNAGYTGVQQSIAETDEAGHCSIWGSWPSQ